MENKNGLIEIFDGYKGGKEMPLAGYAALVGVFSLSFAGLLFAAHESKRDLTENLSVGDLILMGIATHKLSRIISRDRVTSPLRAPFMEYVAPNGTNEVKEKVRGEGLRRAVGDLLHCPYCLSPWVAAGFVFGLVFKPKMTKFVGGTLAVAVISDLFHHFFDEIKSDDEQDD